MQKAIHRQSQAKSPQTLQLGGAAVATPQGEQIAQLEARINASPDMTAQRKLKDVMTHSPHQAAQRQLAEAMNNGPRQTTQLEQSPAPESNRTGLPDNLKSGIEHLSGMAMDSVRVHYNSSQPAQLNALAYAQGTDIHVAPGQEKHLPHEAWHVVQQAQGRVRPTMQMKDGVPVNDDAGLEAEADHMGAKAINSSRALGGARQAKLNPISSQVTAFQRYSYGPSKTRKVKVTGKNDSKQFEECTENSVKFKKGDALPGGTSTGQADWANWLVNQSNGNNATQLHVVNKDWGGLGGASDGNIAPGSPSLNGHHKTEENKFKAKFDSSHKALEDCEYKCSVSPAYGTSVNVTGGDVNYNDSNISVAITDSTGTTSNSVALGDGIKFKDAS